MSAIRRSDVTITPVFLVDCKVCCEGVGREEADSISGGFADRERATEVKNDHLEEHERGEW